MRDINNPYGPRERSIRNIEVNRKPQRGSARPEEAPSTRRPRKGRSGKRLVLVGIVAVVCIAGGVLLSTVFAGAKVSLSPRTEAVTPPGTINAALNAPTGTLAYEIVQVTRTATTTVPATGTKSVSRQASGVVTISNSYSTATQRLIANTRFEAPDGKIYRIRDSVTVPGMQGATPGTVSATLYADSPGDSYNRTTPTTFTIPGFKGDPRYSKFSARSDGPISGGLVGVEPAVAPADLSKAQAELQKKLNDEVTAAAAVAVLEGYVAVPGTLKITFGATAQTPASGNTASIVQSASATGAIVRVADLATAIARASVQGYAGEAVLLDPSSQLTVMAESTTLAQGTLVLTLNGTAVLIWQFDPAAVKQALLGKPKSEFETVIKSFQPAVRCSAQNPCEASIRPFWHSSFPSNPDKITVTIAGQKQP